MSGDDARDPGALVPRPDPSERTIDELRREIAALRELIEARLDGMDKANRVLADNVIAQAKLAENSVGHLKALHDERFLSVAQQFTERDIRDKLAADANKEAIAAALTAARERAQITNQYSAEAAAKVEASLSKSLEQISKLAEAGRAQISDQVAALKERLDRGEGGTAGAAEYRTERRLDTGMITAIVVAVVAVVTVAVTILIATRGH